MPTFFAGQTDYIEKLNDVDAATGTAQAAIDAHIADTTAAHAASAISNTPAGGIAATTVQAAINELDGEKLSASATTLPSSFVNASLNSITPTGGTLEIAGQLGVSNTTGRINVISTTGVNSTFANFVNTGGSYYVGVENSTGSSFDAAPYALLSYAPSGRVIQQIVAGTGVITEASAAGFKVTGSISATNSTGRIDANDSRAAGVGVGGSLFLRGKDDNGDYQDFTGINAFLTDGTVGNVGADLIFKTRLSGTLAERMRLLSSGDLLINQTTNPSSYKLAVTGNVGVTGSISATSLVDISAAGAGQIKFPATQNASADANTLDDYQEATYTGTATGMTTSPTGTVSYTLTGNEATLNLPEITGTSNATTFTVTGMPAEARPASRKTVLGRAQDNGGAIVPVRIDIETTGVLTIYANADAGAFTSSGTKTLAECSVTYTRV